MGVKGLYLSGKYQRHNVLQTEDSDREIDHAWDMIMYAGPKLPEIQYWKCGLV